MKHCCQDNYFSAYTYRQAKIPISEELTFEDSNKPIFESSRAIGESTSNELRQSTAEKLSSIPSYRSDKSDTGSTIDSGPRKL